MNSSTQELSSTPTGSSPGAILSNEEIDASCRVPVLIFFASAAIWFLISAILGLIVSIKLHSPNFLANCAWLTYGRIRPVQMDSLLYGFAAQAAFGVTLWLFCRLGRTRMTYHALPILGAIFWNIGVKVGCLGILAGDSTGFEWLEFPRYASPILFIGYLLIGIWAVLMFHARNKRQLFPTQWYLLAALFWFAWIYSAANLLLVFAPVRGVVQLCVDAWFTSNLLNVWLSLIGVGTIFYFIPKLTHRPLHSYYLAFGAFWGIALFGGWGNLNVNAPLPSWIPALSNIATVMMILPLTCIALNLCQTLPGNSAETKSDSILGFIHFGARLFLVAQLLNVLLALRPLNDFFYFTYFSTAQIHFTVLGFFASVMFGAIYYIAPRLLGMESLPAKSVRRHFLIFVGGILIFGLALLLGGIFQGIALRHSQKTFAAVTKTTLPFLHFSTIGSLLIVIAGLIFIFNLFLLGVRCGRAWREIKKSEARL